MKLLLTIPPNVRFSEVVTHPIVEGIRINTTLPIQGTIEDYLQQAQEQADKKDVWVDLKCRQLRIINYTVDFHNDRETHYIELSHKIKVHLPVEMYIDDGNFSATITDILNGNKLVVPGSVQKKEGLPLPVSSQSGIRPGMSISILDKSLEIDGYLTDKDKEYVESSRKIGMHRYMLSFVEQGSDIDSVRNLDPDAIILAKIESEKGLDFVRQDYRNYRNNITLMAARGDLYVEVDKPDKIINACEDIIRLDPSATFASRMFESLKDLDKIPKCQDLFDVYCGMKLGYKRFLLGDDVCFYKESVLAAIHLFDLLAEKYEHYTPKKKIFFGKLQP